MRLRAIVLIGLSAPRIYAADETAGLLLIEDLGDAKMAALVGRAEDAEALYVLALDTLIALHRHPRARAAAVPIYDDARMLSEAMVLLDWYLPALTGTPVAESVRDDYRARWQKWCCRLPAACPRAWSCAISFPTI